MVAWVPTSLYGGGFGATVVYFTGEITSDPWYGGGLGVTLLYVSVYINKYQ
jgi:hypothetical protein